MIKLTLKLAAVVLLIGTFFFIISQMKNEPDNFNPDKELEFLLEDKDNSK
jgi:hypothetical protein